MYADDIVIYASNQSITEIERAFTDEMENISKWLDNSRHVIDQNKGKLRPCYLRQLKVAQ